MAKVQLHVNEQGHGAVSQICAGGTPVGSVEGLGEEEREGGRLLPRTVLPPCDRCCPTSSHSDLLVVTAAAGGPSACGMIVTSGADGTCRVVDPRRSFQEVACLQLTNFPYSMAAAGAFRLRYPCLAKVSVSQQMEHPIVMLAPLLNRRLGGGGLRRRRAARD